VVNCGELTACVGSQNGARMAVLTESHDSLRKGLPSAVAELGEGHPVEKMQKERRVREMEAKVRHISAQQGIGAAMRYQADCKLFGQYHRLPGIPSSFAAYESYTGNDEMLDFKDWLGDPESSTQHLCNFHETMEHKLKM